MKKAESDKPYHTRNRVRCTFTFNAPMINDFRKLCKDCDIPMSRVFEGFMDTFLQSMRPGDNFRQEYTAMLSFYYDYRKSVEKIPTELGRKRFKMNVTDENGG